MGNTAEGERERWVRGTWCSLKTPVATTGKWSLHLAQQGKLTAKKQGVPEQAARSSLDTQARFCKQDGGWGSSVLRWLDDLVQIMFYVWFSLVYKRQDATPSPHVPPGASNLGDLWLNLGRRTHILPVGIVPTSPHLRSLAFSLPCPIFLFHLVCELIFQGSYFLFGSLVGNLFMFSPLGFSCFLEKRQY